MAFHGASFLFICVSVFIINVLYDSSFDYINEKYYFLPFSHSFVLDQKEENDKYFIAKLQNENGKIISFLQDELMLQENNIKKNIKRSRNNKKMKKRKKLNNSRKSSKYAKINNDIQEISLNEVESGDNDNIENKGIDENKKKLNLKNDCDGGTKKCINKKVRSFTKLMDGINSMNEIKEDTKLKDEENIYDNEVHTVVVYDGLDKKKDLYNKYQKKRKDGMDTIVIQGTEYLGVGYDFIFGNPIGDPFLKVDPGYRDSIIKLTYPKSDIDYPDGYLNINPNGSTVRNEISCNRSENENEISSMSEYTKELSVDAQVGASYGIFGSFSASTGYKSVSNTIAKKKFRMFMLKSYCFKYVAALSQYSQWKLTDQFVRAISLLPSHFNSLEKDGTYCTVEDLRDNEKTEKCGKSVHSWMYFFKNFGTHVSTLIHLGGKITQQVKISKNEYKTLSEKGLSVSVGASGGFGLFKASASTSTESNESSANASSNSSIEKETVIIGGITIYDPNNPKDFEKWAKSTKDNPMPIKGEYEPLSRILPNRLTKIYDEALSFYISLHVPVNIKEVSSGEIKQYDLKNELMKSKIVQGSGTGLVVIECEEKQNFILGFSLSIPNDLSKLENFYMNSCDMDSDKCYSKMGGDVYSYLFAMCNDEMIPFLEQKVKSGSSSLLTLECSEKNQVILFGFGISILNSNDPISVSMYPCRYGKPSCSMQGSTDKSAVGLWIVCGHEESLNSKFTVNIRKMVYNNLYGKKKKHVDICPQKVLFNLLFEFTNTPLNKRDGSCFSVHSVCPNDFHICSQQKNKNKYNYYSVSVY